MDAHKLTERQTQILSRVATFIRGNKPPERPPVMAVTGKRGMGKTTVLHALKAQVTTDEVDSRRIFCAGIVDAAMVPEDLGLMPAVIELLQRSAPKPRAGSHGQGSHGHGIDVEDDGGSDALKRAYDQCLQAALKQEDSHRALARDLAMSPSHFGELLHQALKEKHDLRRAFRDYVQTVCRAHAAQAGNAGGANFRIVVSIDDMDLAGPGMLQRFARGLIDDYGWLEQERDTADGALLWLFTFDRDRMITQLSPARHGGEPDADVGHSLLDKLVPFHRAFDLLAWRHEERRAFVSHSVPPAAPNLEQLLIQAKHPAMLALLPAQPRALEGLYRWLAERSDRSLGEQPLTSHEVLRNVALVTNEQAFAAALEIWPSARFAALLEWESEHESNAFAWAEIAASCGDSAPLWGLPIPGSLRSLLSGVEAEGLFEALIDVLLAKEALTPYQLLQRMPFARAELARSRTVSSVPQSAVVAFFRDATSITAGAVQWQVWRGAAKAWSVEIGPVALWQVVGRARSPVPADLFEALSLPRLKLDNALDKASGTQLRPAVLPQRVRALLWLVAGLARLPWHDVETLPSLWDPLARTRIVAAFTLSAYAWAIWGDVKGAEIPVLHAAVHRSAAALAKLDHEGVARQYRKFIRWLQAQCDAGIPPNEHSPPGVARAAMLRALMDLLALSAVQDIGEGLNEVTVDMAKA